MSLFQKMMASTGLAAAMSSAPVATPPAGESGGQAATPPAPGAAPALSETQMETLLSAARNEGIEEGMKLERDRTAAVMSSDAGKGNIGMAAWMLANNPTATADAISTQLGTLPAGTQAAAAPPASDDGKPPVGDAPTGDGKPATALTNDLNGTPRIDLGQERHDGSGGGGKTDTRTEADKLWDGALERAGGSMLTANKPLAGGYVTGPNNN